MRIPSLLVLLLAAACGSVSPSFDAAPGEGPDGGLPGALEIDGFESGTRLKLRYRVADDGFVQATGWYDSELETNCYLTQLLGGGLACVPDSWGAYYYTDAQCTEGIVDVWNGPGACNLTPLDYAVTYEQGSCETGGVSSVRRIGSATTPAMLYYRAFDGTCQPQGPADPNVIYYALGEEVPLDSFVGAEIVEPTGQTTRVQIASLVADDGARQPAFLRDSQLDAYCYFQSDSSGQARCIPDGYDASYFSDAMCTTGVAQRYAYNCESSYATKWTSDGSACGGGTVSVYELGSELTPTALYYDGGTECYETGFDPTSQFFSLGDEVTDLAQAERVVGDGTSRLRLYRWETDDGFRVRSFGVRDTERDHDCSFNITGDEAMRCVPQTSWGRRLYSDTTCNVPVNVLEWYQGPCTTAEVPEVALVQDPDECPSTVSVAEVGAPMTTTLYERWGDGTCSEYFVSPEVTIYALDTEVPATSFVAVTEMIDE